MMRSVQLRVESWPGRHVVTISASMEALARIAPASAVRGSVETTVSSVVSASINMQTVCIDHMHMHSLL